MAVGVDTDRSAFSENMGKGKGFDLALVEHEVNESVQQDRMAHKQNRLVVDSATEFLLDVEGAFSGESSQGRVMPVAEIICQRSAVTEIFKHLQQFPMVSCIERSIHGFDLMDP